MTKDDLTAIDGIGKKLAAALAANGVDSFTKLAGLDEADIKKLEATGEFNGRNDWAAWIKRAGELVRQPQGGGTAPSNAKAQTGEGAIAGKTMDVAWPPPAGMPDRMLEGASLAVKAKAERGRWRAGRHFTRSETEIPLADLDDAARDALAGDAELVVMLRVAEPS